MSGEKSISSKDGVIVEKKDVHWGNYELLTNTDQLRSILVEMKPEDYTLRGFRWEKTARGRGVQIRAGRTDRVQCGREDIHPRSRGMVVARKHRATWRQEPRPRNSEIHDHCSTLIQHNNKLTMNAA